MSGWSYAALAIGILVIFIGGQLVITRWAANRLAARLRSAWTDVAEANGLRPVGRTLGVALRFEGAIDGRPLHLLAWRRIFSKMLVGWRAWRVVVLEIDARWMCAPSNRDGIVWRVDRLGYQGGRTLSWTGEAQPNDAPVVASGVIGSAERPDLSVDDEALLARRVATGEAWILPDRISLAWTADAADEGEALRRAMDDVRALARLAAGPT